MSDVDSDSEKPKQSNKLGIQQIETQSNNIFNFKERSNRGSSSQQQHQGYNRESGNSYNQQSEKKSVQKQGEKQSQKQGEDESKQANELAKKQQQVKNTNDMNDVKEQQKADGQGKSLQTEVKVNGEQLTLEAKDNTNDKQDKQQKKKQQSNIQQKQENKQQKANQQVVETVIQNQQQNENKQTKVQHQKDNKIQQKDENQKDQKEVKEQQKNLEKQINELSQNNKKQEKQQNSDKKQVKQQIQLQNTKQKEKQLSQKIQQDSKIQKQQNQETKVKQTKVGGLKLISVQQSQQQAESTKPIETTQKQTIKQKQQEQKYAQQLDSDLSALKNSVLKKKKSQKSKQSDKNKLNKTLMPAVASSPRELQFEQTAQIRAMQLNMITKMAQQKKKENYQRLKQWDKRRAQSLAIHRNMIQILQNQIDKRIKSSIQNLQIYTTFLKQKAKQQQKFIAHPVINTKYALQHNTISKNVYINCTVILNALSDQNNIRCRKINDFIHLIRNDILRDSVDVHLMQSQKQLLKIREKISNLKAALRKYNAQTQEKTSQLSLFFNQNAVNMAIDGQRDFYLTQIQFLQKASQQTSVQKKLGQYCLQYLHTAMNQQAKRSKVIRDSMITFSKALQQCYGIQPDSAEIQQLSKAQQNKLIEQFYSLQQIFDQRCLTVYKTHQNMESSKMLTVQIFSNFLNKFQFQGFDCRVVLLKQYNVRYHPSSKNQTNREQNCYLVITVDKFIHLFLSKEKTDPYARPDVTIKVSMKNLQLKPVKNELLDIVIKDEKRNSMISYFWETKNDRNYRVQFAKKDAREEFMDYIRKLRG